MTSFYTSLSGLKNAETDLNVIAHNIANAETSGFKKSNAQFADIMASSANSDPRLAVGIGARVASINQNFTLGSMEQTGRSLDLAIGGDGFFATRNPENSEILFTRNGNMRINSAGNITDSSGQILQVFATDAAGTLTGSTPTDALAPLTNGTGAELSNLTVEKNGTVFASYTDGSSAAIGRITVAHFTISEGLAAVGQTNWKATGISGNPVYGMPTTANVGPVLAGMLERSNVDLAEEMVSLISAQRNFQANAKAIDTATQISQTIINLRT